MQDFYKKALIALILLLVADALVAVFCVLQSYPSAELMPPGRSGIGWRVGTMTDAEQGGTSTVRVLSSSQRSLRFDFRLTNATTYPFVSAEMVMENEKGNVTPADLSKYSTITFVAKCSPANTLLFSMPTFDKKVSKPGEFLTYPTPGTYFSCNEKGTAVSLDMTRLTIPQWWYEVLKLDLAHQSYTLDQVAKLAFGVSPHSASERDSQVEISQLTLHGRDYRYLVALATLIVMSWGLFALWFVRAHARALVTGLNAKVKKDLPLVAYRELTLEPFRDKEKAAVLCYIATHYTNPQLDLENVVAGTGANRNKINEVLKAELGMTFTAYVKKLRLTEAARLLTENPAATVSEVAYSVGYGNVSYFNKLFKEEYSCTPKVFKSVALRNDALPGSDRVLPADLPSPEHAEHARHDFHDS